MTAKLKNGLLIGLLSASVVCSGTAIGVSVATIEPEKGANGAQGVGITDIETSYVYDEDGNESVVYTYVLSEGDPIVKTEETGKKIVDLDDFELVGYEDEEEMYNVFTVGAVTELPDMTVTVYLDDGTERTIPVTDDMIETNIDFTKAGLYDFVITVGDQKMDMGEMMGGMPVFDGETPVMSMFQSQGGNTAPVVLSTDIGNADVELYGMYWMQVKSWDAVMNGNMEDLMTPVTADQIKEVTYTEDGFYDVLLTDGVGEAVVTLYLTDEISATNYKGGYIATENYDTQYIAKNGAYDVSDTYFAINYTEELSKDGMGATYYLPVTAANVTLDTTTTGEKEATLTYKVGEDTIISEPKNVVVYETKETVSTLELDYFDFDDLSDPYAYFLYNSSTTYYADAEKETTLATESETGRYVYLYEVELKEEVDFTTPGVKGFTVLYEGEEFNFAVEIPAEPTGEIVSLNNMMGQPMEFAVTMNQGENAGLVIRKAYLNTAVVVEYDNHDTSYTMIMPGMLDWSDVDSATVGTYTATLTIQGFVQEIKVTVVEPTPDMTDVEVVYTLIADENSTPFLYTFDEVGRAMPTNATLYANNYAKLVFAYYDAYYVYAKYTLDTTTGAIVFNVNGTEYKAKATDLDNTDSVAFDAILAVAEDEVDYSTKTPVATYTVVIQGTESTLKLYDDNNLVLTNEYLVDGEIYEYTLVDGVLEFLLGGYMECRYAVVNGELVEIYTGNY